MTALSARLAALPRAARWGLYAAAAIGGYFLVVEPALDTTNALRVRADQMQSLLAQRRALESDAGEAGSLRQTTLASFGSPLLPGEGAAREEALYRVVNQILDDHGVTERRVNERRSVIRGDRFAPIVGPQGQIERFGLEIRFDAPPETVSAVLAALEAAREVATVSRVDLRRADTGRDDAARLLRATVVPEAWTIARGGIRR